MNLLHTSARTLAASWSGLFAIVLLIGSIEVTTLLARTEEYEQIVPATGSLDLSFTAVVTDGEGTSRTSEVLPDGRILVGGSFTLVNGVNKQSLAMLNSDGSLDPSFNPGLIGPNGTIYEIVRLSDGRFLIGGGL